MGTPKSTPALPAYRNPVTELHLRAFVRKARQAVHQILFYVGLGYETTSLLPLSLMRKLKEDTNSDIAASSDDMQRRIRALMQTVNWDKSIADELPVRCWECLIQKLAKHPGFPHGGDDSLREACGCFLDNSDVLSLSPDPLPNWRGKLLLFQSWAFEHFLPTLWKWLRKALTMILVAGVIVIVCWKVSQVGAIFHNAGWPMTLLLAAALLTPFLLAWMVAPLKRKAGVVYFWDFGGAPFRSWKWQARTPERGFPFFGKDSKLPGRLLRRVFMNAGLYVGSLLVVCLLALMHWRLTGETHILTAALVMGIFYSLLGLASMVDFLDFFSRHPIRLYFIGIGCLVYVTSNLESGTGIAFLVFLICFAYNMLRVVRGTASPICHPFFALVFFFLSCITFYAFFTQQSKEWRGQGSRVERLGPEEWPWNTDSSEPEPIVVMAASGGGSRAAVYTALTLEALHRDHPQTARNLQAVSSVSGGSLANAVYVARRLNNIQEHPRWLLKGVEGDYILSALRGLVNLKGRGKQIEETWRREPTGLGEITISGLVKAWRNRDGREYPPFPVPIFNTSTLDTFDVVISPLGQEAYSPGDLTRSAKQKNRYQSIPERFQGLSEEWIQAQPTWVYYRDGIYGLEELLPDFDPELTQSVRASANFPFGFPLVRFRTTNPLYFSPLKDERRAGGTVFLTDGGVLSNSGMWPLYRLLMNRVDDLRKRGVLLIVVEASRMPEYPKTRKKISGLLTAIGSRDPIGQSLHRRMIEALGQAFGDRIEVVQVDLVPTVPVNVVTTWTLSRKALETLRTSFQHRWECQGTNSTQCQCLKDEIGKAWDRLKAAAARPHPQPRSLEAAQPRPPIS